MKRIFYLLTSLLAITLSGCASLTKSQIESVNQFAVTTRNFSDYPSKIMTGLSDIRIKRGVYYANSLSDPKLHIGELDSIYVQKNFDYQVSDKTDITFRIIDKYAQALLLLSSDNHSRELELQSKRFGISIDSLIEINNSLKGTMKIPSGIGAGVNKLIVTGGNQYMRSRQAKQIKKFVRGADTLVSIMCKNLLDYLQSENIAELIYGEEKGLSQNYLSYIRQNEHSSIQNDLEYLDLKSKMDGVRKLQQQTIASTIAMRNAHKELLKSIEKKKKLKESIAGLQELYEDIKDLQKTIKKIEK